MHKYPIISSKSMMPGLLGVLMVAGAALPAWCQTPAAPAAGPATAPAPKEKKVKDVAEYDIFNSVLKDQNSNNPQKALQDLDTWTQKYPDSDWKDQRLYMYMQEYAKLNPPNAQKVLDYGAQVMNKGLKNVFDDPKEAPRQILNCLFLITVNAAALTDPTPEQIDSGQEGGAAVEG